MSALRVLALMRYGRLGASSRLRMLQYLPALRAAGVTVEASALLDDAALTVRYARGKYRLRAILESFARRIAALRQRRAFDVLWIEKEALPWWPLWIEAAMLRDIPYVLDYDDAVFHNYDRNRHLMVRCALGHRLDGLMAKAALVLAGNEYLADRARAAGAPRVELLPTVIDLERYQARRAHREQMGNPTPRVVWIGSSSTEAYLQVLREPLQALAKQVPFTLRVIGGDFALLGMPVESVRWTETGEVAAIAECDIGVMPLFDTPWERGKCGYKLIQYMACGLPVVASPVGVNRAIVKSGKNGFLAEGAQAWMEALQRLLTHADLRARMGAAGRAQVEREYCLQVTAPKLTGWLHAAARGNQSVLRGFEK